MTFKFPFKKIIISIFVSFTLFTILFINCPLFVLKAANETLDKYNAPVFAHKVRFIAWLIRRYAHLVGIDNRWQMFSTLHRFNWWYVVSAKYKDSGSITLPIPMQSKRTFLEKEFIDFKEAKFYLNIYNNALGREAYAHYLCRQYPKLDGSPIESIIYELNYQNILPLKEARKQKRTQEHKINNMFLNEFKCPEVLAKK